MGLGLLVLVATMGGSYTWSVQVLALGCCVGSAVQLIIIISVSPNTSRFMSLYAACVGGQTLHTDHNRRLRESMVMVSDTAVRPLSASRTQPSFVLQPRRNIKRDVSMVSTFPPTRVTELSAWRMPKSYAVNGDRGNGILLQHPRRIQTSAFFDVLGIRPFGALYIIPPISLTLLDPSRPKLRNFTKQELICLPGVAPSTSSRGLPGASLAYILLVCFFAMAAS